MPRDKEIRHHLGTGTLYGICLESSLCSSSRAGRERPVQTGGVQTRYKLTDLRVLPMGVSHQRGREPSKAVSYQRVCLIRG